MGRWAAISNNMYYLIMNKPTFQSINRYLLSTVTAVGSLGGLLINTAVAQAAEINPTPGTYSYGSTSEFSPLAPLSQGSNLAPTGQSQVIGYLVVGILLISVGVIAYVLVRRRKQTSGYKPEKTS
jgi:LPXTG-motif cell wall-anchored protein